MSDYEFYNIQRQIGGKSKFLVDFPPTQLTTVELIEQLYESKPSKRQTDWKEICITFKQMFRDELQDREIKNLTYYVIQSLMKGSAQVCLIPEWTDNLHLHFHGFIRGSPTRLNTIRLGLEKYLGRISMKCIGNTPAYFEYITKDFKKNQQMIPRYKQYIINL